jgi:hypothetical protein
MTEPVSPESPRSQSSVVKGCGCSTGLAVMALGILVAGNFNRESWGSAIGAIVIGVLVWMLSGSNGFWERS